MDVEERLDRAMVSISSSYNYATPIETQLERVAAAGFTHFSLGANLKHFDYTDLTACRDLGRRADKLGMRIDTVHGKSLDRDDAERS